MDKEESLTIEFSGRVSVVTGAGGGIGREIAISLARAGASVAVIDSNEQDNRGTEKLITDFGGFALAVTCDVSDEASVLAAADRVHSTFGHCDVLINNAGVIAYGRLESVPKKDWDRLISINLSGYMLCSQVFVSPMLERGRGSVVHVASIAATEPHPFCSAYGVSKAGVVMLSNQMALEWGPRGVRSNCVSPGFVRTGLSEPFYSRPGVTEARSALVPCRRIGTPKDIANAALFLASDLATYINGHNLIVDGGISQSSMISVPRPGYSNAANGSK